MPKRSAKSGITEAITVGYMERVKGTGSKREFPEGVGIFCPTVLTRILTSFLTTSFCGERRVPARTGTERMARLGGQRPVWFRI